MADGRGALGGLAKKKWLEAQSRAAQKSVKSGFAAVATPLSCGYGSALATDSPINLQSHLASYDSGSDDEAACAQDGIGSNSGRPSSSPRERASHAVAASSGQEAKTKVSLPTEGKEPSIDTICANKRRRLQQASEALKSAGFLRVRESLACFVAYFW